MEGPETAESKGRQQSWWKVVCRASLVALTFYALYWSYAHSQRSWCPPAAFECAHHDLSVRGRGRGISRWDGGRFPGSIGTVIFPGK